MCVHAFISGYVARRSKEIAAAREWSGGGGGGVYRLRILDEILK
jgi:hypothetical protein